MNSNIYRIAKGQEYFVKRRSGEQNRIFSNRKIAQRYAEKHVRMGQKFTKDYSRKLRK